MSKVEEVAAAIWGKAKSSQNICWEDATEMATAAIEAMRSPDDAMTDAIEAQLEKWIDDQGVGVDVYLAAIDAALKEQTK